MKLLWVKTDFLHPTTRGGQIRTLETVKRLHRRHQVHYIAFADAPEGPARAHEYCTQFHSVHHDVPEKRLTSPAFLGQLLGGLISPVPVTIRRWSSTAMRNKIAELHARERYDAIVCDFLYCAPNIPDLSKAILFQHNVEAQIWQRHATQAQGAARRLYFQMQAARMEAYEGRVCRQVKRVIAVSEIDAQRMRTEYGASAVTAVATGVDVEFFARPAAMASKADLVFLGSMDWMSNIEGVQWFVREILPRIQARLPGVQLAIVGRKPGPEIMALAGGSVEVTGTVTDVRPWLWGSKVSIVPLRIGGGTRLKIYESMAAGVPVVSTSIGAEGLETRDGENIAIADDSEAFAQRCVDLLTAQPEREAMAAQALHMVTQHYSWDSVIRQFEDLLG